MKTEAIIQTITDVAVITLFMGMMCEASRDYNRSRNWSFRPQGSWQSQSGSGRGRSDDPSWRSSSTGQSYRLPPVSAGSNWQASGMGRGKPAQPHSTQRSDAASTSASRLPFLLGEVPEIRGWKGKRNVDHLVLALDWMPSKAEINLMYGRIKEGIEPKWIIHGLWYGDSEEVEEGTWELRLPINMHHNLTNELTTVWPPVLIKESGDVLWSHEWCKHGIYFRLNFPSDFEGPEDYFQNTMDLFESSVVRQALTKITQQLPPGDAIRRSSDVYDEIYKAFEKRVGLICYTGTSRTPIVTQIRLCLNMEFEFIDCSEKVNLIKDCEEYVRIPQTYSMYNSWMLIIHWMPTRNLKQKLAHYYNLKDPVPQWKVNLLGFNMENENSVVTFSKNKSTQYYENERQFTTNVPQDLRNELSEICDRGYNEDVIRTMQRMWYFYGVATLLREIPNIAEEQPQRQHSFFSTAVNLYKRLQPNEVFSVIPQNRNIPLSAFRGAIANRLGKNVTVNFSCFQPKRSHDHYIFEIFVCFNFDGTPTDCLLQVYEFDTIKKCGENVFYFNKL